MAKQTPKPPALQVLFEPWPASANADREGYEVFAGQYLIDALDESGAFKARGFRAVVQGCTTCRRSDKNERVHWLQGNDLAPEKPKRRCPQWKKVESIVKAFGGWKRVHYVELAEHEGLAYQPIPQRRREIATCAACAGTGYGPFNIREIATTDCPAGCGSYSSRRGRGEVIHVYPGPVPPDRIGMREEQLRKRV